TGETTMLGLVQDQEALIIDKVDSRQALKIASPIGTRVALHCSSIGRALLAHQPEDFIAQCLGKLPRRTARTITSRTELRKVLEAVRRDGVAECIDEWEVGVSGVAAPIRDRGGAVIGSFCITGPTSRLSPDRIARLRLRAIAAAAEISRALGYRAA
ncbi:MAG: IclR family transcriptional regulator, partial [Alphaproteobacteria bacterium]|nr:IclR family transcriptional regulator [Alphaproteobacteria bacterium]